MRSGLWWSERDGWEKYPIAVLEDLMKARRNLNVLGLLLKFDIFQLYGRCFAVFINAIFLTVLPKQFCLKFVVF
jgi:hypothetical protein